MSGHAAATIGSLHPTEGLRNCRDCIRGGDAIALVHHVEGCGYREALAVLGGIDISARGRRAPPQSTANDYLTLSVAVRIWDQAVALGPEAIAYFEGRGIAIDAVPDQAAFAGFPTVRGGSGTKPCVVGTLHDRHRQ